MTEDNDYKRVTVGELSRRFDVGMDTLKEGISELKEEIKDLKLGYVQANVYAAEQSELRRRVELLEKFMSSQIGKPERTLQTLVRDFAIPAVLCVLGVLITLGLHIK